MREILFRGKKMVDNGWAYGYIKKTSSGIFILAKDKDGTAHPVTSETVGQYTGLTDKNGTKIFEGDIVESRASENKADWEKWTVLFQDGSFCFEREIPKKRKHKYAQNLLCEDEIELYGLVIVGNIHDNPELLTGGANDE